ncbi:MAG TPA: sulfite exporter TauE/SafE family protein [Stellaceae bacterium]|nr:sulfite exporter TauE/SafE family protein [Stellaceae bacterium]
MINLWDPTHVNVTVDLLTAFLLGLVHGITPDEHTWPITFSYAIGSYSTRRGLFAGLTFSLAFTVQQALASELAHLGLSRWFTFETFDGVIYAVVGIVMAAAGFYITGRGWLPHLHLPDRHDAARPVTQPRELEPWMPAVHGFIAGWGLDAFSVIIYTTLAPAMPSAALGWLPGLVFGLGTLLVQAAAGAAFGLWAARRGLSAQAVRSIALMTAARTLTWGGVAFFLFGAFALAFPKAADYGIETPLRIHNLDSLGLPFLLVIFTVIGVGVTTFIRETLAWRRREIGAVNAE